MSDCVYCGKLHVWSPDERRNTIALMAAQIASGMVGRGFSDEHVIEQASTLALKLAKKIDEASQ